MRRTPSYMAVLIAALVAAAFSTTVHIDAAQAGGSLNPRVMSR